MKRLEHVFLLFVWLKIRLIFVLCFGRKQSQWREIPLTDPRGPHVFKCRRLLKTVGLALSESRDPFSSNWRPGSSKVWQSNEINETDARWCSRPNCGNVGVIDRVLIPFAVHLSTSIRSAHGREVIWPIYRSAMQFLRHRNAFPASKLMCRTGNALSDDPIKCSEAHEMTMLMFYWSFTRFSQWKLEKGTGSFLVFGFHLGHWLATLNALFLKCNLESAAHWSNVLHTSWMIP